MGRLAMIKGLSEASVMMKRLGAVIKRLRAMIKRSGAIIKALSVMVMGRSANGQCYHYPFNTNKFQPESPCPTSPAVENYTIVKHATGSHCPAISTGAWGSAIPYTLKTPHHSARKCVMNRPSQRKSLQAPLHFRAKCVLIVYF